MIDWTKGNAAALRRMVETQTFKTFIDNAKERHPKVAGVKTLEEAALIGARKEGREEILQELMDSAQWSEAEQDSGQSQEPL